MGRFSHPSRKGSGIFLTLSLFTLALFMARGYSQSTCINQSPRDLTLNRTTNEPPVMGLDYNFSRMTSLIVPVDEKTIQYQGQTLHICDRHYHVPVENLQGCKDERAGTPKDPPPVGQWIEFHSVYALVVNSDEGCAEGPDRDLACCRTPPFVVRAFSAKITAPGTPPPIKQPDKGLLAEWSGSNTSLDKPPENCKPLPAQWSFRFGCDFTVSQSQLEPDMHPHRAREVQSPMRTSPDLAIVGSPPDVGGACREVRTALISTNTFAQKWACPAACKAPLNRFSGKWRTVPEGYSLCTCCPLLRPQ
jgi:hypothetical protein